MMKRILLIFILAPLFSLQLWSQTEIVTVAPSVFVKGQTAPVVIKCSNTHFQQGITNLFFSADVFATNIKVLDPVTLTATLTIDQNAVAGTRNLNILTKAESVSMTDAIEIIIEGSSVRAIITLLPVKNIYISDFDKNNLKNSPIIFLVNVMNDNQKRYLKVYFTLKHEKYGQIATADKTFPVTQPMAIQSFTNRDLEHFDVSSASSTLLEQGAKTGMLPPGKYTYAITVMDSIGVLLATEEVTDELLGDLSTIDLISPGNGLYYNPEVIYTKIPEFVWISDLSSFDFTLYEVMPGQQTADEILSNIPLYRSLQTLNGSSLIYPPSAEILDTGKIYAWQIIGYNIPPEAQTSKKEEGFKSDLFWFTIGKNYPLPENTVLKVVPEQLDMKTGETIKLMATLTNTLTNEYKDISKLCDWKVVPASAGYVDNEGLFRARIPGYAAIVANYNNINSYSTISIKVIDYENFQEFWIEKLFDSIFGLDKN